MSEHPPPAPDWILGEDGHWKPPPFDGGARSTAAPSAPAPPVPPPGPPTGTWPPSGAWPPPPGGGPQWAPPPATGPSAGRVVAWVVGGLAVAGVAVVGILVTAVTFLGTTAEPEARFTPVGSSLPDDGEDDAFTPVGEDDEALDAPSAPAMTETMRTVDLVFDALSDAWIPTGGEELPVEIDDPDACAPDGWLSRATDRYRTYWDRPGGPVTDALTLSLTAYADEAAAAEDLARARTPEYQACEVEQARVEFAGATDASLQALPDDPRAPGVTYQVDVTGIERPTEYDFTVVVGHLRAHLDFCGCVDMDLEAQRQVARDVALALADAQGLPAPG